MVHGPKSGNEDSRYQVPPYSLLDNSQWNIVYNTSQYFDPSILVGCKPEKKKISKYVYSSNSVPAIHTPVVIGKMESKCHIMMPPVTMAKGTYVRMSLEGSTFAQDAFWALPIFNWSHTETEKYKWKYLVQWLLWRTGKTVKVFWEVSNNQQSPTTKLRPTSKFKSELPKCDDSSFDSCIISAITSLFGHSDFKTETLKWFRALKLSGYIFPTGVRRIKASANTSQDKILWIHPTYINSSTSVRQKQVTVVANLDQSKSLYTVTCRNFTGFPRLPRRPFTPSTKLDLSRPWHQFDNILLIILFNSAHYNIIPHLEILYRSFFPNILYCGPNFPDLEEVPALKRYQFSFVTYTSKVKGVAHAGLNYECTMKAIRLQYNVKGYFVIADDILVMLHALTEFPLNALWYRAESRMQTVDLITMRECNLGECKVKIRWMWWKLYRLNIMRVLETMKEKQQTSQLFKRCYLQLIRQNGAEFRVNGGGGSADIYYIPSQLAQDFADLAQIFVDNKVYLELAVPTIIRCLVQSEDIQVLHGNTLWAESRKNPWNHFVRSEMFNKTYFHPAKWSSLVTGSSPDITRFYCDDVIFNFFYPNSSRFRL